MSPVFAHELNNVRRFFFLLCLNQRSFGRLGAQPPNMSRAHGDRARGRAHNGKPSEGARAHGEQDAMSRLVYGRVLFGFVLAVVVAAVYADSFGLGSKWWVITESSQRAGEKKVHRYSTAPFISFCPFSEVLWP